ncbi:DUF305 domain-containing protein [Streptomyces shenzhenensis]|uniref:DUF305 domain-containing protein n=1 Tax=Streptomyces shenzhenensis TaxID=943815 RepID=UPI001F45C78F|nr:DUF305 domain-containing protein [Streptomyces shenzhenensis]
MTAFTCAPRRKPTPRLAALGVIVAGALILSACSSNSDDMGGMPGMDHGSTTSSATATSTTGVYNEADVKFAQMMIPHHEQALEMAKLANGRASDSAIKNIAAKIEKAQDPEITTLKGWLQSWAKPEAMGDMPGMSMGEGMMSGKDMKGLKSMTGAEFDKMFAQMMIQHHDGAISMAKDEQKKGHNADAKKMAGDIATGQSTEVKQLQSILDRL